MAYGKRKRSTQAVTEPPPDDIEERVIAFLKMATGGTDTALLPFSKWYDAVHRVAHLRCLEHDFQYPLRPLDTVEIGMAYVFRKAISENLLRNIAESKLVLKGRRAMLRRKLPSWQNLRTLGNPVPRHEAREHSSAILTSPEVGSGSRPKLPMTQKGTLSSGSGLATRYVDKGSSSLDLASLDPAPLNTTGVAPVANVITIGKAGSASSSLKKRSTTPDLSEGRNSEEPTEFDVYSLSELVHLPSVGGIDDMPSPSVTSLDPVIATSLWGKYSEAALRDESTVSSLGEASSTLPQELAPQPSVADAESPATIDTVLLSPPYPEACRLVGGKALESSSTTEGYTGHPIILFGNATSSSDEVYSAPEGGSHLLSEPFKATPESTVRLLRPVPKHSRVHDASSASGRNDEEMGGHPPIARENCQASGETTSCVPLLFSSPLHRAECYAIVRNALNTAELVGPSAGRDAYATPEELQEFIWIMHALTRLQQYADRVTPSAMRS